VNLVEQSFLVRPDIGLLNRYAQKARQVAITQIDPIFESGNLADQKDLSALRINVEGPSKYLQYFQRLIDGADLRVLDKNA
jgi:hypothetical protein